MINRIVARLRGWRNQARVGGVFTVQHLRGGRVIDEWKSKNLIPYQGLDNMLGVWLTQVSQTAAWYLAPFGNNYTPNPSDTATTIVANAGEVTAYTATSRQQFVGVEANQSCTNAASPATLTFTAATTIYGAFLISSNGKSSTSGILAAASLFTTPKQVAVNDQLIITYTVNLAAA